MKKVFFSHSRANPDLSDMIAGVLDEAGIALLRLDAVQPGDEWRSTVLAAIRQSDIFIAAMDGHNPNVMLELGYAMGAGKQVLLVRSPGTKVPLDVDSLLIKTVADRFDTAAVREIAAWIKDLAGADTQPQEYASTTALLEALVHSQEALDSVRPAEFESRVAEFLGDIGFESELLPVRNDMGFDIMLTSRDLDRPIVVEAKKYNRNSRVPISAVQRIVGAAVVANAGAAMIITTGSFTSSAVYFSETSPIPVLLLTVEELLATTKENMTARCSAAWRARDA